MSSSSEINSNCLIELAEEESPTSNHTPMISFPPISVDEMIVQPFFGRTSLDNNPFDMFEKQAKLFGDPFELKGTSRNPSIGSNDNVVPTGSLIEVDGNNTPDKRRCQFNSPGWSSKCNSFENQCETSQQHTRSNCNDSPNLLNTAMVTTASITTDSSSMVSNCSHSLNRGFIQDNSLNQSSSSTSNPNRNRISSDPVTSKKTKSMRKLASGKSRSASLEQLCVKKQLLKSLSNSPIGSPNWSKNTNHGMNCENANLHQAILSVQQEVKSRSHNGTTDSISDDLLSTRPEWIDSENEDSDIERMTIPFLKNIRDSESTLESTNDCTADRIDVIEKLSKYRKGVEDVEDSTESVDEKKSDSSMTVSPQTHNFSTIIETLRDVVNSCADVKKKHDASAVLDNLNVYFNNVGINSSSSSEPQAIVRQRTFSLDKELTISDADHESKVVVNHMLNKTLPVLTPTRRSINTTTPNSSRKSFARSLSYAGKPLSAVSAVQNQSKRNSVCTTPTRITKQLSASNPTPVKSRLSMTSHTKEPKSMPKPVQRKSITKMSKPVPPSSSVAPISLKLRVGEQTRPTAPLKAVVPYQHVSSTYITEANSKDLSANMKKHLKTSTPVTSCIRSKSGVPAASSTPVMNNVAKPSSMTLQFADNRSRLSYTPSTPNKNVSFREPAFERKKRSVSFSAETDKMSTSMIGPSSSSKSQSVHVTQIQRRSLSRSYGNNKENTIHQKK